MLVCVNRKKKKIEEKKRELLFLFKKIFWEYLKINRIFFLFKISNYWNLFSLKEQKFGILKYQTVGFEFVIVWRLSQQRRRQHSGFIISDFLSIYLYRSLDIYILIYCLYKRKCRPEPRTSCVDLNCILFYI